MEKFYTVPEAAEILKVCRSTLETEMRRGKLKSIKVAGARRISETDLQKYIEICRDNNIGKPMFTRTRRKKSAVDCMAKI